MRRCRSSKARGRRRGPGISPGGSRRNLDWVLLHTDAGTVGEDDLLLLADAQTSGGLLVAGELAGARVMGSWSRAAAACSSSGSPATAHQPCPRRSAIA